MDECRVAKFIEFGDGGDTVYYGNGCRSHGYGSPEHPHAAVHEPPDTILPDGCLALDIRPALETSEGVRHVFRGPMVDVDLEEGEVDTCPEPSMILRAGVAGNSYGSLLALQDVHRQAQPNTPGPLDSVSIAEFVRGWVKLGARVGVVKDGEIVWEEGA